MEQFHHRLVAVENKLHKVQVAPTFPIYDINDLPQDVVTGQIALGTDNSIGWFDGSWHTYPGSPSFIGNMP